jgi:hypothetical protein
LNNLKYALILITLFSFNTFSKENDGWFDTLLVKLGLNDDKFDEDKIIDFSIIPGPFYNPEMSLGLGVSAVGLYRVNKEDKDTQLSSLVINGFGSINGAFGVGIKNKTFLKEDNLRFYVDGAAYRSIESYYGVGEEVNRNDGNAFDYDKEQYEIKPSILKKLFKNTFIGPGFHFNYTSGDDVQPSANFSTPSTTGEINFPNSSTIMGINLRAFHDSRDFVLNAYGGRYLDFSITYFDEVFGSQADFRKIAFEWDEYFSISEDGKNILAFQFRTESNKGEVPWDQFAFIGGSYGLRGYYEGRYRDNNMILSQLEWRHRIRKPHGVVAWIGGAMLADTYTEFNNSRLLKNIGIGYRLEVKERVNVRFDYGIGDGESGFYMNIAEAF